MLPNCSAGPLERLVGNKYTVSRKSHETSVSLRPSSVRVETLEELISPRDEYFVIIIFTPVVKIPGVKNKS